MKTVSRVVTTTLLRTQNELMAVIFIDARASNLMLIILFIFLLCACNKREEIGYYPTGEIEFRAPLDKEGVFDGEVTHFYKNGVIKCILPFHHHHINGVLKRYSEDGKLESTEVFKNGKNDGILNLFYLNGKLKYEAKLKDDVHTDTAQYYYPNGEVYQTIVYDDKGRKTDYAVRLPNGKLDTRYTGPIFLSDTDNLRDGQDYSFEIVLGNRQSNVVTIKVVTPSAGVDSTRGTHAKTKYIIHHPTLGSHEVMAKIKLEWARKGSDTIWSDTGSVRHFFYVDK